MIRDNGIKTNLVDKAGHNWSLEGYTRTVIRTTTARTYNDLRIQSMKDFDSVLATMSSHPASRPACAPIRGKIVNIVPRESARYDPKYPSIYDHGYGKPSGCFGINCGHKLYPYIKGVSHNFQKQYDPKEAIEKQKIQQKQRYYERNIRRLKYDLDLARRQNDVSSERKFNQAIRGYQAKLRDLVKDNDFLTRQYDREQTIFGTGRYTINQSGAKKYLTPAQENKRQIEFAKRYYRDLRGSDVDKLTTTISRNSGVRSDVVKAAIDHIFHSKYELFDPETYETILRNFDENVDIAQSFRRLRAGKPEKHDIILLKHESYEADLMDNHGYGYAEAH